MHLIHSEVCDIYSNPTKRGKKYFVTFIDDFSKYCYVYLHSKIMCEINLKFIEIKLRIFVTLKLSAPEVIKEVNINFLNFLIC